MVASQKPFADDPTGGASVVQLPHVRANATPEEIVAAAQAAQRVINTRFGRGAEHVVLDEVRTNTAPVAAELFKHIPPDQRGKLAAFVVGGSGVKYENNPTLAPVWAGMTRNHIQAMPETYGGPNLHGEAMAAAAQDARNKVAWLRARGILASPAVSPLDVYHNPTGALTPDPRFDPATTTDDAWRAQLGNEHATQWVNALRKVMPNIPLSEWAVGGTKNKPLPGRRMLASILR